jgi:hypothetical protein
MRLFCESWKEYFWATCQMPVWAYAIGSSPVRYLPSGPALATKPAMPVFFCCVLNAS